MARFNFLWTVPVAAVLAGCLSVTPGGLLEASRFNPLTTNPADIGAGLGVPETIRLADGDAMIVMTYTANGAGAPLVNERFALQVADSTGVAGAPKPYPGERVYFARLSNLDALRMKDVQARIRQYKAEGVDGKGSFSIGLRGGCATTLPVPALQVRTFIKVRPGGPLVETTRRSDVLKTLPPAERQQLAGSIRLCQS